MLNFTSKITVSPAADDKLWYVLASKTTRANSFNKSLISVFIYLYHLYIVLFLFLWQTLTNLTKSQGFPGSSVVKNLPAKQETLVRSLGWEDTPEKEMATHSNILVWEIPWTDKPGGLKSPWVTKKSGMS